MGKNERMEKSRMAMARSSSGAPVSVGSASERPSAAREAIFAAATRLFGERGYTGTTMRDIAKSVGILPGSLYAHIQSKEEVLLEIIEGGVDRFNSAVDRIDAMQLAPEAALRQAVREHLRIVADNPGRTLIVFHQWRFLDDDNRDRLLAKRAHYEAFFLRTVHSGIELGHFNQNLDAKVVVLAVLGALNWTPEWFSPNGHDSPEEVADKIADGLLGGMLRP
jgi:TetR/AcrR family transcriptional regulator, cholesterol catabolism regulator